MDEYSAAISKRTYSMSIIKASYVMSFRDSALFSEIYFEHMTKSCLEKVF